MHHFNYKKRYIYKSFHKYTSFECAALQDLEKILDSLMLNATSETKFGDGDRMKDLIGLLGVAYILILCAVIAILVRHIIVNTNENVQGKKKRSRYDLEQQWKRQVREQRTNTEKMMIRYLNFLNMLNEMNESNKQSNNRPKQASIDVSQFFKVGKSISLFEYTINNGDDVVGKWCKY